MRKTIIAELFLIFIFILFSNFAKAQTDTEFWFVAPEVSSDHGDSPVLLRITTGEKASDVTISMPANQFGFPDLEYSIAPNSTQTINLTDLGFQSEVENMYEFLGGVFGKNNKGIYIEATNPVTAYYEVNDIRNTDIFTLKGKNALGKEFYGIFQTVGYNQSYSSWMFPTYSALDIVATADNTTVTFESTQDQKFYGYGIGTFQVVLNKGETLSLIPDWTTDIPTTTCTPGKYDNDLFGRAGADRLSGVRITSDKDIAITKKDDSVRYRCIDFWEGGCFDLIGDQLVPVKNLGLEYIVMKGNLYLPASVSGSGSNAPENVYIVATEDNTEIYINGSALPIASIDAGETYIYEFWDDNVEAAHIRGTKKILVLHITGFGCEVGGAIIPSIDECKGSSEVVITRSTEEDFYLNLMVTAGSEDSVYIDGILQDGSTGTLFGPSDFQSVAGSPNWVVYRSENLDLGQFPVETQVSITNTLGLMHIGVINGGTNTGCRYGYFSNFVENRGGVLSDVSSSGSITICEGESVELMASGGYRYQWSPADYLSDPTIANPVATPPAGNHTYQVTLSRPCYADTTIDVFIKVISPQADFEVDVNEGCSPLEVAFTNTSTGTDINAWSWDFDDGTTENVQNPFPKTYTNTSGNTIVKNIELSVTTSHGCSSSKTVPVTIYSSVEADFTADVTEGCNPLVAQFTNTSANTTSYLWDFDDGETSDIDSPSHTFTNSTTTDKVFNISLKAESEHGCKDSTYTNLTVFSYLDANFSMDTDKGCSPLNSTFVNLSVGNSSNTYQWLMDNNPIEASPTDLTSFSHTLANQSSVIDEYEMKLVAANPHGCTSEHKDTVTVYPELTFEFSDTNHVSCHGAADGSVSVSVLTGVPAFSYLWSTGETSASISELNSGFYRVTVYDAFGCNASNNITINEPPQASLELLTTNISCYGMENGSIAINSGEQYSNYQWSTGSTNSMISNLTPGLYSVTVTNENDCILSGASEIHEPEELVIYTDSYTDSICPENSGHINITVHGGTMPYNYNWSNSENTEDLSNLTPGFYALSVTDANDCFSMKEFHVDSIKPNGATEISYITVDSLSQKNIVVWDKELIQTITYYNIYRYNTDFDYYETIGVVDYDNAGYYIDHSSPVNEKSSKYKISNINICADESSESNYHKTIFLTLSVDDNSESVNLNWEAYEIESESLDWTAYVVLRGEDSLSLEPLDTVSLSENSFTDQNTDLSDKKYYRVAGLKVANKMSVGNSYQLVLSNMVSAELSTGKESLRGIESSLNIYPNPFNEEVNIDYYLNSSTQVNIEIFDVMGNRITTLVNDTQNQGQHTLLFQPQKYGYNRGVYYVKLRFDSKEISKKIIQIR